MFVHEEKEARKEGEKKVVVRGQPWDIKEKRVIHTRKTNEETGYVEYVGREPRLVMVHSILLARLISNDID